jgi:hypothetical protein
MVNSLNTLACKLQEREHTLLDGCKVGDEVEASFNLRGREWQDKHFNSLELWKIEVLTAAAVAPAHVPDQPGDDLPF